MSVLEGVTLLTRSGYSDQFVLDYISLDTFKDLVLVAQKLQVLHYQQIGLAFTLAMASVLSKEGAAQAAGMATSQLEKLDTAFVGDDNDEDDDEEWVDAPVRRKRRKKGTADQRRIESMARKFHANFGRISGMQIPSFDAALAKARVEKRAFLAQPPQE